MKHAWLLLLVAGCTPTIADVGDYKSLAAAVVATQPVASVAPPKVIETTHDRAKCPTAGWVTHGDGHKTRCPDCRPTWESQEEPKQEPVPPAPVAEPVPRVQYYYRPQPQPTYQRRGLFRR